MKNEIVFECPLHNKCTSEPENREQAFAFQLHDDVKGMYRVSSIKDEAMRKDQTKYLLKVLKIHIDSMEKLCEL